MLDKFLILTEGIADIVFLRDYLTFLNPNLKSEEKRIEKQLILKSTNKQIIIKGIGGYTKLNMEKNQIVQCLDENYKILVIQDTDNLSKSHGGIEARKKYLMDIKEELSIEFEIFLFPNNKDDGDLETLLLKIVKEDKYKPTNDCYDNFIKNEGELKIGFSDELKDSKGLIFNYFRAYNGMEKAKEHNRVYLNTHWNFDNLYLKDLFDFFKENKIFDLS